MLLLFTTFFFACAAMLVSAIFLVGLGSSETVDKRVLGGCPLEKGKLRQLAFGVQREEDGAPLQL